MKKILFSFVLIFIVKNTFCQNIYPHVFIETSEGNMEILLYDNTPMHSENFLELVNSGFYDNLLFHRTIPGFMIQAGDPDSKGAPKGKMLGSGGPTYTIPAEFNPENYHKRGALAAARQPDRVNPQKASSGSQFYIVQGRPYTIEELNNMVQQRIHIDFTEEQKQIYTSVGGSPHLDYSYTVFGEIISGFDVLERISNKSTDQNDRPLEDVIILRAYTNNK